jgi:2-hydroxychromene-2-carboxylate isomerase
MGALDGGTGAGIERGPVLQSSAQAVLRRRRGRAAARVAPIAPLRPAAIVSRLCDSPHPGSAHGAHRPSPAVPLKRLLMPAISQRWLSRERLRKHREHVELLRRARGLPHQVHVFHQLDDPYSALLATALPRFAQRYRVEIVAHLVRPPADSAVPERDMLVAYARTDAQRLARHCGLEWRDPGAQPPAEAIEQAGRVLLAAIEAKRFVDLAAPVGTALWQGTAPDATLPAASSAALQAHVARAQHTRAKLGHYLGAMLYYGGEWYWGIDRLHHLERRLQKLRAQRGEFGDLLFPPDLGPPPPQALTQPPAIDFYFSLRSPYSAIAVPRVFALARATGATVKLRYVLPMVMRGLPVPPEKRRYIALDAAREAHLHGIAFGRICDPVGLPTERGLALMPLAERAGRAPGYVESFMQGAWAEGIDAGTDRGLRRIAERAGLSWDDAREALQDESWRAVAEANRAEMFSLGLWGVPSFRVHDTVVWGQDRLWAVREALEAAAAPAA